MVYESLDPNVLFVHFKCPFCTLQQTLRHLYSWTESKFLICVCHAFPWAALLPELYQQYDIVFSLLLYSMFYVKPYRIGVKYSLIVLGGRRTKFCVAWPILPPPTQLGLTIYLPVSVPWDVLVGVSWPLLRKWGGGGTGWGGQAGR